MVWSHLKVFWFSKDNPTGAVKGKRRGRHKKRWEDNIKEWTGMEFVNLTGQLKTGQGGKGLLQIYLWCLDRHHL